MSLTMLDPPACTVHTSAILGEGHEANRSRTWWVIALCEAMMIAEIAGGLVFGSIALVADGLHMSTHAGALLLAALAYSFASRHATDPRFTFGTGKARLIALACSKPPEGHARWSLRLSWAISLVSPALSFSP